MIYESISHYAKCQAKKCDLGLISRSFYGHMQYCVEIAYYIQLKNKN